MADKENYNVLGRRTGGADLGPIEKVIGRKQQGDIELPNPRKAPAKPDVGRQLQQAGKGLKQLRGITRSMGGGGGR